MRNSWSVVVASLLLASCATTSTLPDPVKTQSAIQFARDLRVATSAALDKVVVSIDRGDSSDHPWGTQYAAWWCPRSEHAYGRAAIVAQFRDYCSGHQGRVVDARKPSGEVGFFCASQSNPDLVQFTFNTGKDVSTDPRYSHMGCSGGYETARVLIEEPRSGDVRNSAYRDLLYQEGFRTAEEAEADAKAAVVAREIAQRRAVAEAEAQRLKELRQRILPNTPVGSQVCLSQQGSLSKYSGWVISGQAVMTEDAGVTEAVGFLEGRSGPRIQIRISGLNFRAKNGERSTPGTWHYKGSTVAPNSTIWDDASFWHLCE